MSIHVRRTGSRASWVRIALLIAFTVVVLVTGYFGMATAHAATTL
jgi:hypothetical protein